MDLRLAVATVLVCFLRATDISVSLNWYIRATELDVTIIGLQNAGKTSLLRVLSVPELPPITEVSMLMRYWRARSLLASTSSVLQFD